MILVISQNEKKIFITLYKCYESLEDVLIIILNLYKIFVRITYKFSLIKLGRKINKLKKYINLINMIIKKYRIVKPTVNKSK
jgi:hypothetical protein